MNVLGVFAHPDDEVLGAGGTLAKHAEAGDNVLICILGRRTLESELREAASVLGAFAVRIHDFPDQAFDTVLFTLLADALSGYDQDIIYTHHPGDLNLDHALTARAVLTAFRPKPGKKPRTILACEVLSSTEWTFPQVFQPNWFEALSLDQLNKKVLAMKCYPLEEKCPRDELGIRTQAVHRALQIGAEPVYAEAFQLLRRGPC